MSSDKEKAEQKKLQDEYDKSEKKLYKLIEENSTLAQNQDEYKNIEIWRTNPLKFKRNWIR